MPISLNKKIKISLIVRILAIGFAVLAIVLFSWVFLFIYKNLYFAILQESAISKLRTQLIITKVNKNKFEDIVQQFEEKQNPLTTINFQNIKNPFASQ